MQEWIAEEGILYLYNVKQYTCRGGFHIRPYKVKDHEMVRNKVCHGHGLEDLLKRYFKQENNQKYQEKPTFLVPPGTLIIDCAFVASFLIILYPLPTEATCL